MQFLVKRILQLGLLLHAVHIYFHSLFLLKNAHIGLLFKLKLSFHRLNLFASLCRLLFDFIYLFQRVLRLLILLVHGLLSVLALLSQASQAMCQRLLRSVKQNFDFIDVFFDHELAIAKLADWSTLPLPVCPHGRTRVNPRLLHTLCIVGETAESAEDHLFRVLEGIVAGWALLDSLLSFDGACTRKNTVIVLVGRVDLSQLEVLTLF